MKIRMDKKLIIAVLLIVIAGAIGFVLYVQANTNHGVKEVSYNEFLGAVQGRQVSTVYLVDEAKIKGIFSDGTVFVTDNPRTENFKEMLLKNQIKVEEHKVNATLTNALSSFGVILVIGGMGLYLSKQASKQTSREFSRMSQFEAIPQGEVQVTFAQVAGNVEAKESILDLVDFLRNPEKYSKYGARIPRGVILYGPPGTGKTLLAKALAGEAGVPFYAVSGSDFIQIYAGLGAGRIRSLFKKAREKGKCVIFIDEIDALGKKRDGFNGKDESDRTLNALLTEMSGFNENEGIIVIAATNRLDTLDDALLRPGRFDRQVEVGLPDVKARHQILQVHSRRKPLSQNIDLGKLAHQTVYFSGAELESLLNEAAILAAKQGAPHIDLSHIDKAYYTVIAGEEKKDRSMISKKDREITAYHEAGHALITKLIAPENRVTKVTIIPSTKGAGGFSMNIPPDSMYRSKMEMVHNIQIALAGRIAEEIVYGEENITTGASNDIEKATEIVTAMVKHFGMNKKAGIINYDVLYGGRGVGMDSEVISECRRIMEELHQETKQLMKEHVNILNEITALLLDKETLNEEDLNEIIFCRAKAAI